MGAGGCSPSTASSSVLTSGTWAPGAVFAPPGLAGIGGGGEQRAIDGYGMDANMDDYYLSISMAAQRREEELEKPSPGPFRSRTSPDHRDHLHLSGKEGCRSIPPSVRVCPQCTGRLSQPPARNGPRRDNVDFYVFLFGFVFIGKINISA